MASDNERIQAHLIIRGYVQGVFFRARLAEQAESGGVIGWCRNLDDGSVEAEIEGTQSKVDAVIAWARIGPPAARVESVDIVSGQPAGVTARVFEIR